MEQYKGTREEYFLEAVEILRNGLFKQKGHEIPPVKVSCGYPPRGGTGTRKMTLGVCTSRSCSDAQINEIFINPTLSELISTEQEAGVLGVLVHELVHAVDDCQHGHGKEFRDIAKAVGLEGKMTSTTESEELNRYFENSIIKKLGGYPHASLTVNNKKQGTRMLKVECPVLGCESMAYQSNKQLTENPVLCSHHKKLLIHIPKD
jgi:hypothetical protein